MTMLMVASQKAREALAEGLLLDPVAFGRGPLPPQESSVCVSLVRIDTPVRAACPPYLAQ